MKGDSILKKISIYHDARPQQNQIGYFDEDSKSIRQNISVGSPV